MLNQDEAVRGTPKILENYSTHAYNRTIREVERIIRVDHAGEYGAINIYKAQAMISRVFYPDIVYKLEEMLSHEEEHYATFNSLLMRRSTRSCFALPLWAWGGFLLGLMTACLGRNAIWTCTNAIETSVLQHLKHQLNFLKVHDFEAYQAVLSIKADEEAHQELGASQSVKSWLSTPVFFIVTRSTQLVIWLSTKL
jgi:ubiquinone biosynthesis monooxygenase Coq7